MAKRLLTPAELLLAPTGLDWSTVAEDIGIAVQGPSAATQAIEQLQIIDAASSWVADYCEQPQGLHATTQTETARVARAGSYGSKAWVDLWGWMNFKTSTLPVISASVFQWAYPPAPLVYNVVTPFSPIIKGSYPQIFTVQDTSINWTFAKSSSTVVQCTYVSGFANAVSTASITAGSSVAIPVDDSTGMGTSNTSHPELLPFMNTLRIFDGANTEDVTVSSVTDGTHIVVSTLANNHASGVGISSVPLNIKWACIHACTWLARERGVQVISLPSRAVLGSKATGELMSDAEFLLEPYIVKI